MTSILIKPIKSHCDKMHPHQSSTQMILHTMFCRHLTWEKKKTHVVLHTYFLAIPLASATPTTTQFSTAHSEDFLVNENVCSHCFNTWSHHNFEINRRLNMTEHFCKKDWKNTHKWKPLLDSVILQMFQLIQTLRCDTQLKQVDFFGSQEAFINIILFLLFSLILECYQSIWFYSFSFLLFSKIIGYQISRNQARLPATGQTHHGFHHEVTFSFSQQMQTVITHSNKPFFCLTTHCHYWDIQKCF